jgi:hypothetical protein
VLLRRIAVHLEILPAIAEIALIGVVDGQPPVDEDAEALGGLAVVLVDLGNPLGEIVHQVVDRVVQGDLD